MKNFKVLFGVRSWDFEIQILIFMIQAKICLIKQFSKIYLGWYYTFVVIHVYVYSTTMWMIVLFIWYVKKRWTWKENLWSNKWMNEWNKHLCSHEFRVEIRFRLYWMIKHTLKTLYFWKYWSDQFVHSFYGKKFPFIYWNIYVKIWVLQYVRRTL